MTNTYQVGDIVNVLNSIRLPKVEQVIAQGRIERITESSKGEPLYWIEGVSVARSERVLRRAPEAAGMIAYQLPNGKAVHVPFDVCRAASTIDYTMEDGRIVLAVIAPGQR